MRCSASVVPCLALAAHMLKLPVPQSLPMPPEGLGDPELSSLADSLNLDLDVVDGEGLEELASRPLKGPVVLLFGDGGAVLFAGRVPGRPVAAVFDPMAKPVKQVNVPFAELASRWTGLALLLSPRRLAHRHVHALVSMAREYGKDLSAEDLIHAYVLEGREPDQSLFMRMIGDQGLVGHDAPATLDALAQMTAGLPFLLHCTGGGLLILWQMDGGRLEIENPDRPHLGRTWVSRGEVEPLLDGQVTFIKPGKQGVPGLMAPKKKFGLSFFIGEMRHMFASLGEVGAAAVAIQLLGLATPLFLQVIIDTVVTHHALSTLHILGMSMAAAIGFECLFFWLRSYLLLYVTSVIDLRLSISTFEHLASLPLPFFERNPAGVIIKHMQQPEKIREFLTGRVFGTLLDCVSLVVVLPILFLYAWQLTAVVLLFSALSALTIFLAMGPFQRRLQDLYATDGERQAFLVENIRAMPTVKSLSLEKKQRKGWDDRTAVATGMRFRVGRMGISINAFMTVMQQGMMLATLWWGVYLVFDNVLTVGALVAFNMYSQRVAGPLAQLAGLIQQYQETAVSLRMLGQVMDEPAEMSGARGVLPRIDGGIRCKGLTFRYSKDGAPALSDISFEIGAGKTLGIVGRSGSGKSTLTRLIQRLQPMQQGDIWIDSHNIRDIDMVHLRRSIGVVLQENFLFRGRVRDNIAMTKPAATIKEIQHAAKTAAAHDFIEKLPKGYDTILEEGGANLSGGQRQRLAIARALLTNPRLMIFDEATSALDPESEAEIQKNIAAISAGRTMIIVSHRLSMLRHADKILVLENGRLAGDGTHEELYAACPQYAAMWDRQNRVREGAA